MGRVSDPDLTDIGREQRQILAEYLAEQVARYQITHLYTSLMQRAIQTALPAAQALNLPLQAEMELHETGGLYLEDEETGEPVGQVGRTREEYQTLFPSLLLPERLDGNGWWNRPFETIEERPHRANRVVDWLLKTHTQPDDRVAIFSHYGFFNYFLWAMFGQVRPPRSLFTIYNTSISGFEIDADGVRALFINRVDHLPARLVTE